MDFELADGVESILISEIKGIPASDYLSATSATPLFVESFMMKAAQAMRHIHDLPAGCPLDQRLDAKFAKARENVKNGLVDETDFDKDRIGKNAEQIYDELRTERPGDEELVFTHGGLCLPNIIVLDNKVAGFIDFDRACVADRYQDIELFLRSFNFNTTVASDGERIFCNAYGIEELDRVKLTFYKKLDELF